MFTVELGGHTARTHTQKGENPVNDIEQHATHCDGANVGGITQVADDRHVHQSQQGDGDVRHDRRQGYIQYVLVGLFHCSGKGTQKC